MTVGEPKHTEDRATEAMRFFKSLAFPVILVVLIWMVKAVEMAFDLELYTLGLFPQTVRGLRGIILAPFIHGDIAHLISNTFPILLLGSALFYFYRNVAFRVMLFSVLITGAWVWVVGRPSYHIGASGVIYSLAAFLFVSGVIRRHPRLMALSLLVVFLYGGMVWGVFPVQERISWESHLMGVFSGILLAVYFRAHGPQRKKYSWELEEETEPDEAAPATDPAPGGDAGMEGLPGLQERQDGGITHTGDQPARYGYHYMEGSGRPEKNNRDADPEGQKTV